MSVAIIYDFSAGIFGEDIMNGAAEWQDAFYVLKGQTKGSRDVPVTKVRSLSLLVTYSESVILLFECKQVICFCAEHLNIKGTNPGQKFFRRLFGLKFLNTHLIKSSWKFRK